MRVTGDEREVTLSWEQNGVRYPYVATLSIGTVRRYMLWRRRIAPHVRTQSGYTASQLIPSSQRGQSNDAPKVVCMYTWHRVATDTANTSWT